LEIRKFSISLKESWWGWDTVESGTPLALFDTGGILVKGIDRGLLNVREAKTFEEESELIDRRIILDTVAKSVSG
jgi:hypothetical protein